MPENRFIRFITISLFISSSLFFAANLGVGIVFAGRAWPGATLSGHSIGGQTASQIKSLATNLAANQTPLQLSVGGQEFHLAPDAIGSKPDLSGMVSEALQPPPGSWLPILGLLHQPTINQSYQADSERLEQALSQVVSKINQPPTDARIAITEGQISIVPGTPGKGLELEDTKSAVQSALSVGADSLALSVGSVKPTVTAETLQPLVERLQQLIDLPVTLTYEKQTFKPSKAVIGSWLEEKPSDNGPHIVVNPDQIKAYLSKIGKTINVAAKNNVIDTINGEVRSNTPGTNGLAINQEALVATISQSLLAAQTVKTEIPTQVVPFKTVYNRTYNLDHPKYIEVNLSSQHLWVYQDHQVVFDTAITSGAAGNGHPTVQGLYAVYTKQTNRYLDGRPLGYNYNVYVQYWMPFHRDYGLHDASWRSSFGGQDYYYGGSHGCVNMPIPAAAWLYNWVDVGTPVWVHS